jgi:hypothetical protein
MSSACIICGTRTGIERNHVGGRNHIAWFTAPFCKLHHDQFHEHLRNAGVDLRYTSNALERLNRASQAMIICQLLVNQAMKAAISKQSNA